MTEILTPDQIIEALNEVRDQASNGINMLYEAEIELAKANAEAERKESLTFMRVGGLVADRTALAKLESADEREAADLAKAKYNRVKALLQSLNNQQTAIQTQARMVEITWRTS